MARNEIPALQEMVNLVKKYDKRVGMRLIYKNFEMDTETKQKVKHLWDEIEKHLKEQKNATGKGIQPSDNLKEHKQAEQGGLSTEAGDSNSNEQGGQEIEAPQKEESLKKKQAGPKALRTNKNEKGLMAGPKAQKISVKEKNIRTESPEKEGLNLNVDEKENTLILKNGLKERKKNECQC